MPDTGTFGITINLKTSQTNVNDAIKQLQQYVDGKKLNINLNISPAVLKGLEQLTQQATAQAQKIKGVWTETLTPLEKLKNLKVTFDGEQAVKQVGQLKTATGDVLQVTQRLFNVYSEDGRIIGQVWKESTETILTLNQDLVVMLKHMYDEFVADFTVKVESMQSKFGAFANTEAIEKLKAQLKSLDVNEHVEHELELIAVQLKEIQIQAQAAKTAFTQIDSIQAFKDKTLFSLDSIKNAEQLSEQITIIKDKLSTINGNNFTKVFKEGIAEDLASLRQLDAQLTATAESTQKLALYQEKMQNQIANLQIGKSAVFARPEIQAELNRLLADLSKVGTAGGKSVEQLNLQFAQLRTSVRTAASEISMINREADNFATTLIKDFGKMMAWTLVATAMFAPLRALEQGIEDVEKLNNVLTQTATAMNTTVDHLGALTTAAQQMSQTMGANIDDVLQIMHIYANVNETADSIIKKTKADTILSNITGMTGQETTDVLQGIQQQFNLADDQLMHVDDAITKIASNLRVNYQTAIKEIGEGVKTAGTMAQHAGLSFEQFASIIGVTEEKTRRSGSEIANSMKMIMARVGQIQSGDVEVSGEDMSKAAQALKSIGVDVLDQNNQLRNMGDILGDVSKKWDSLTADEKAYISFAAAGTRQYSMFQAIMDGYAKSTDLATQALNANGNALKQQDTYMQSTEAKINTLKSTIASMWQNTIDSSFINSIVTGITGLVNSFGNLPTVILTVVSALTLWKGTSLLTIGTAGNLSGSLITLGTGIRTFATSLEGLTAKEIVTTLASKTLGTALTSLKAAFLANPIGVALTAITTAFTVFEMVSQGMSQAAEKSKQEFDDLIQSISKLKQENTEIPSLISSYGQLSGQALKTAEEKQKLADVTQKLANLFPQTVEGLDAEGNAAKLDIGYMNQLAAAKEKLYNTEQEKLSSNFLASGNNDFSQLEKNQQQIKRWTDLATQYKKAINNIMSGKVDENKTMGLQYYSTNLDKLDGQIKDLEDKNQGLINTLTGGAHAFDQASDSANKLSQGAIMGLVDTISKNGGSLKDLQSKMKDLENSGFDQKLESFNKQLAIMASQSKSNDEMLGVVNKAVKDLSPSLQKAGYDAKSAGEYIKNSLILSNTDDAKDKIDTVAKATQNYTDNLKQLQSVIQDVSEAMAEYDKTGNLSGNTILDLIQKYPSLISQLQLQNGQLVLNKQAMIDLKNEEIKTVADKITAEEQLTNAQAQQIKQRISNLLAEAQAAEQAARAEYSASLGATFVGPILTPALQQATDLQNQLNAINNSIANDVNAKINALANQVGSESYQKTAGSYDKAANKKEQKNQPSYEDPMDSLIRSINIHADILAKQNDSIKAQIEQAKQQDNINLAIQKTNELMAGEKAQINEIGNANRDLQNRLNAYGHSDWLDANGEATNTYYNLFNSSSKEAQENMAKELSDMQKLKKAIIDNTKTVSDLKQAWLDNANKIADQVIDSYKKAYEEQKQAALDAIDAQEKALDDQLAKEEKIIAAKEKQIDLQATQEDYAKKLAATQKEAQDIQNQINALSMDNSIEAKAKRGELQKQLSDKTGEITDMQTQHNRDARKQNLEDQLQKDQDTTQAKKDALDQKKTDITYYYDQLINNEQKYAQIRQQIITGSVNTIKTELNKFITDLTKITATNAQKIGLSYQDIVSAITQLQASITGVSGIKKFDSGGYTGDWSGDGRIAMLHQKELVLNQVDTSNLLKVINITRNLVSNIKLPDLSQFKAPSLATAGSPIYNLTLNIDNLNGTKSDADMVFNRIATGLKKLGI